MSLDRFIFCTCTHTLEAHGNTGCTGCDCSFISREVIDRLLDQEREAIRRAWRGCGPADVAADTPGGPANYGK